MVNMTKFTIRNFTQNYNFATCTLHIIFHLEYTLQFEQKYFYFHNNYFLQLHSLLNFSPHKRFYRFIYFNFKKIVHVYMDLLSLNASVNMNDINSFTCEQRLSAIILKALYEKFSITT